jgi:hypothetical protein
MVRLKGSGNLIIFSYHTVSRTRDLPARSILPHSSILKLIQLRGTNTNKNIYDTLKSNSVALSPRTNYTDWVTATCRRNLALNSNNKEICIVRNCCTCTSPWISIHSTSLPLHSLHFHTQIYFSSADFISLYFTSRNITALHFTSLHILLFATRRNIPEDTIPHIHLTRCTTFLTFFLKVLGLQERVPKASAGNWFQSCMVLFTEEYFPTSVFCFLPLILLSWWTLLARLLQSITYGLPCPISRVCSKRPNLQVIFRRCAKVPQFKSFLWCANLAALFCTRSRAFICPSL